MKKYYVVNDFNTDTALWFFTIHIENQQLDFHTLIQDYCYKRFGSSYKTWYIREYYSVYFKQEYLNFYNDHHSNLWFIPELNCLFNEIHWEDNACYYKLNNATYKFKQCRISNTSTNALFKLIAEKIKIKPWFKVIPATKHSWENCIHFDEEQLTYSIVFDYNTKKYTLEKEIV